MIKKSDKIISISLASLIILSSSIKSLALKENHQEKNQDSKVLEQVKAPQEKISDNQKKYSYNQYLEIASEVSQSTGQQVDVLSMNEFKESEWVYLDKSKGIAIELANYTVETS
ncbi:hypothetical protein Curi_c14580 [Gottschalkia acidurici 9a]|uniref:Uncharacterized protein n=1 Tax=Gottschalkia acidurici (strain ATCC 7906 / DSM 604 / BCRC 14475 / CIP 104303 / KCTC 5404 / NCIMB 10678 / 9a) TaxID=1128398 RepID=K0AXD1_GOTA9|nr:hypothetical protein [Gottschalkia acidurici]AFS78468.1 hypothetical protein Curi_c14580 [Gottschalkia acidurici 9a]